MSQVEQEEAKDTHEQIIALMMWKIRHSLPALALRITEQDRKAFADSLEYNEQKPKVNIEYRGKNDARVTIVHLTDQKTGDQIVCTENNEADLDAAQSAADLRQTRQSAPMIAAQLRRDLSQGTISNESIEEACRSLVALSKA